RSFTGRSMNLLGFWDKLLETSVNLDAHELLLVPGMAPLVKMPTGLRELAMAALTDVDIGSLLLGVAPVDKLPTPTNLTFEASHRGYAFRVQSFGMPRPRLAVVMRLADPPAALEDGGPASED